MNRSASPSIAEQFADRRSRVREAGRRFRERQRAQREAQRLADAAERDEPAAERPADPQVSPRASRSLPIPVEAEPLTFRRWLARIERPTDSLGDIIAQLREAYLSGALSDGDWRSIRLYAEREGLDVRLCASLWDAFSQAQRRLSD